MDLGRRNEALATCVREQVDAWQAVVHCVVEAGVADGELETSLIGPAAASPFPGPRKYPTPADVLHGSHFVYGCPGRHSVVALQLRAEKFS